MLFVVLIQLDIAHALDDLGIGENLVAGELDGADLVLRPFKNVILHVQRVGGGMHQLHILDLEIQVAVLVVEIAERIAIGVKIVLLEITAAGEPGEEPAPAELELAAEFLLRKGGGPDEHDIRDLDLGAFLDVVDDHAMPGKLINVEDVLDLGIGQAVLFVELLHLLDVREDLLVVQRFAHLDGDFFAELGVGKLVVALDADLGDARAHLHRIGQDDPAVIRRIHLDADVVELAGAVKGMDIILRLPGDEHAAGFEFDVGTDEFLADGGGTDEFDVNPVDLGPDILRHCGGGAAQQHRDAEGLENGFHFSPPVGDVFGTEFCCAFKSCVFFQERQAHVAGRTVTLLGDEQIHRHAFALVNDVAVIVFGGVRLV